MLLNVFYNLLLSKIQIEGVLFTSKLPRRLSYKKKSKLKQVLPWVLKTIENSFHFLIEMLPSSGMWKYTYKTLWVKVSFNPNSFVFPCGSLWFFTTLMENSKQNSPLIWMSLIFMCNLAHDVSILFNFVFEKYFSEITLSVNTAGTCIIR